MKRDTKTVHLKFGTFDLTKDDLVNLEKLILGNVTLTDHSDHVVRLGKMDNFFSYDQVRTSARYIPEKARIYHHAQIKVTAPNILVDFRPRRTDVYVEREFYKSEVLQQQSKVADELEKYFRGKSVTRSVLSQLFHRNAIRVACRSAY